MKVLTKVLRFVINNRRVIGVIVGATLTLAGFSEEGEYIGKVGAL